MKGTVKDNDYSFDEFLLGVKREDSSFTQKLMDAAESRGNKMVYTIIYLGPGDYHRYHSPANCKFHYRRHIAGWLEPVKPAYVFKHKEVFKDNERVSLLGEWDEGFFAVSYVGALNVGAIELHYDNELKTNIMNPDYFNDKVYMNQDSFRECPKFMNDLNSVRDEFFVKEDLTEAMPFTFEAGEEMGMFKFGSTIVLMMEVPQSMDLNLERGQKLQYGQNILSH